MDYPPPPGFTPPPKRTMRLGLKIALVSAGLAAGAIGATAIAAGAQTSTTAGAPSTASTAPAVPDGDGGPGRGHGGAAPMRGDEKTVTTAQAATLKSAALKAVPGGTVIRVETDSGDGVYEAHMTKADGTDVTVKFDKNLAVTGVEDGMGK
ncbi:MAG: hypothetical protein M3Y44_07365 [Actinomycetota bacterium]|nr:hypothetical protein [Actinomycetota bacterium]